MKLRPVASAAEKPAGSEADAMDLVVVSESVSSGAVADAFKDVTKPVLMLEAFIADDMLVAVPGTAANQTQVDILNPDHPLAAGLSGAVDIYKAAKILSTFTSTSTDAIKVASAVGQPDTGALVAFLKGAKMESDFVAPGRRVCLGLHSAVPEEYTSQARALFRAAVSWSLSPEKSVLFVHAPSGGAPSATDQALIDELSRGLGHKVKLRPVASAAEKPAGSEADAIDLVVVSESVSSGAVTDAFKDVTKPVLMLEAFIADDMLVAAPGTVATQTQVDILNPDHP
ncbi:MAG: hypothetical protein FJ404_18370, partial [Verrucomicrobia bacterium]|nr:hypothetical protein [Verrucomicrobiota bacterium]